ncbi:MAG: hypothetical protein EXR73_06135, partial [Myxococcales bacterium]|nr:hypothetical protein [Myxococcales bacterium]
MQRIEMKEAPLERRFQRELLADLYCGDGGEVIGHRDVRLAARIEREEEQAAWGHALSAQLAQADGERGGIAVVVDAGGEHDAGHYTVVGGLGWGNFGAAWASANVMPGRAFQKKQARRRGIRSPETLGLCFLQRFGSLLQLNPHGHAVVPDAVFALDPTGTLQFVALPPPTMAELQAVGLGIVKGIRRALDRALARARD